MAVKQKTDQEKLLKVLRKLRQRNCELLRWLRRPQKVRPDQSARY
jgi:hypothetical protein